MSVKVRGFQYAEISLASIIDCYRKHVLSATFADDENFTEWYVDTAKQMVIFRALEPETVAPESKASVAATKPITRRGVVCIGAERELAAIQEAGPMRPQSL